MSTVRGTAGPPSGAHRERPGRTRLEPRPTTGWQYGTRGLLKRHPNKIADADLDIRPFALLGPNGAGKTTAMETLEGYRRADEGDVRVLGIEPAQANQRRARAPRVGIVAQSSRAEAELVHHFTGYYPNLGDPDEAIASRTARRDPAESRVETVLAPPVAARLLSRLRTPATAAAQPSPRGLEVLAAVAPSLGNAEIGRELFVGEATTKTHLQRLFAKLDVDDRTHPVTVAIERGLSPSPRNR